MPNKCETENGPHIAGFILKNSTIPGVPTANNLLSLYQPLSYIVE